MFLLAWHTGPSTRSTPRQPRKFSVSSRSGVFTVCFCRFDDVVSAHELLHTSLRNARFSCMCVHCALCIVHRYYRSFPGCRLVWTRALHSGCFLRSLHQLFPQRELCAITHEPQRYCSLNTSAFTAYPPEFVYCISFASRCCCQKLNTAPTPPPILFVSGWDCFGYTFTICLASCIVGVSGCRMSAENNILRVLATVNMAIFMFSLCSVLFSVLLSFHNLRLE